MKSPLVIGVSGGSGSGKTTLADRLAELFPDEAVLIHHDDYYRDLSAMPPDARLDVNFDCPEALETDLLIDHLRALKRGEAVECPRYVYADHTRAPDTRRLEPRPLILLEGILIFADPALAAEIDLKIFLDTDPDECLVRRIRRDTAGARNMDLSWILRQYLETVKPMFEKYVAPTRALADIVLPKGSRTETAVALIAAYAREKLRETE